MAFNSIEFDGLPKDASGAFGLVSLLGADPEFEDGEAVKVDPYAIPLNELPLMGFTPRNVKHIPVLNLYGMARPGYPDRIDDIPYALAWLVSRNVQFLISLSNPEMAASYDAPYIQPTWEKEGRIYAHIPTADHHENPDYTPPSVEQLTAFAELYKTARKANMTVAVYCGEGFGRSGLYIAALSMTLEAESSPPGETPSPTKALAFLEEHYHTTSLEEIAGNRSASALSQLSESLEMSTDLRETP